MARIKDWVSHHKKITGVLGFFAIAGTALAVAWMSQGTGESSGQIGSGLAPLVVTAGPSNGSLLYPGGDSDASFTITNTSGTPLSIVSVVDTGGDRSIIGPNPNGCTATQLNTGVLVNTGKGVGIPVPEGTHDIVVPNVWHGTPGLAGDCQGVSFSKALTVTAGP